MRIYKSYLLALILGLVMVQAQNSQAYYNSLTKTPAAHYVDRGLIRTELYFGRNKPDGSMVSDEEWGKFLADVVTSRFPDGFTVVDGMGQFRGKDGVIVRESSKMLVILYSKKGRRQSSAKIEEIRTEYRKRFQQESVLRVDLTKDVEVFF